MTINFLFSLFLLQILSMLAPSVAGGATGRLSGADAEPFVELLSYEQQLSSNHFPSLGCYSCTGCKDPKKLSSIDIKICSGNVEVKPVNWEAVGLNEEELDKFRGCLEVEERSSWGGGISRHKCKTPPEFNESNPEAHPPKYYIKPVCIVVSDAYGVLKRDCHKNYVEGNSQDDDNNLGIRGECGKVKRIKDDPRSFACYCKDYSCNGQSLESVESSSSSPRFCPLLLLLILSKFA